MSFDLKELERIATEERQGLLASARSALGHRVRCEAEDVVQEALCIAWMNRDSFRGTGSMRSWVGGIVRGQAKSLWRRKEPVLLPNAECTDPAELNLSTPSAQEGYVLMNEVNKIVFSRLSVRCARSLRSWMYELGSASLRAQDNARYTARSVMQRAVALADCRLQSDKYK